MPFTPPSSAQAFECAEGKVVVWFPAQGIAAGQCVGHVTGELARMAYVLVDQQPVFPYEGFIDMLDVTGFDWEARGRALKFNLVHLSPKMQLHMLVASPALLVASKVFELVLREHVEIHRERATFESAYALAVKRHTRARPSEAPPPMPRRGR